MSLPKAHKPWGQHFLKDPGAIDKILGDYPKDCQAILEVGPGTGALTAGLSRLGKPLAALERDPRFLPILRPLLGDNRLIIADALEIDYEKLIAEHFGEGRRIWAVSNLPYQIAAPLSVRFFSLPDLKSMTLMFQKEVGEKIHPKEGTPNPASRLWLLGQNYFEIKKLASLPPKAFSPPPKVDSVVLSFRRRPSPTIPPEKFGELEAFARRLFSHKRKQILSVLSPHYGRRAAMELLGDTGIPTTLRAESLNLQRAQTLFRIVSERLCTKPPSPREHGN